MDVLVAGELLLVGAGRAVDANVAVFGAESEEF